MVDDEKVNKLTIQFEKTSLDDLTYQMIQQKEYVTNRNELDPTLKPKLANSAPYRRELVLGKEYLYCTCGYSKSQPFCDGSHEGTGFLPLYFKKEKEVKWSLLCGCKQNDIKAGPFCDGNHIDLQW